MNKGDSTSILKALFRQYTGQDAETITPLSPGSGSPRIYYRIASGGISCIGTYNHDLAENQAFIYLSDHFRHQGLPVPEVFITNTQKTHYLQSDLGDTSLYSLLQEGLKEDQLPLFRKTLEHLVRFQFGSSKKIDYNRCFPVPAFDRQAAQWDLHYFKYMFVKLSGASIDEPAMEKEFGILLNDLTDEIPDAFMYRDFQSRNIMILNQQPWFIDFQGGRKGHPAYDVASLLYQSRINLDKATRENLIQYYLEVAKAHSPIIGEAFMKKMPGFALLRTLQTLGAYGYRGLFERKPLFIRPIASAIRNALQITEAFPPDLTPYYIRSLLEQLLPDYESVNIPEDKLTITIQSFSYMHGLPVDPSGNGGGYLFDCRALPNPHRITELRPYTGKDEPVRDWLSHQEEVNQFLNHCWELSKASINNYQLRGFSRLQISFGCTGGKHRSVYCAERLTALLKQWNSHLNIETHHLAQRFES